MSWQMASDPGYAAQSGQVPPASFPPEVIQVALTVGLGTPTREYRKQSQGPRSSAITGNTRISAWVWGALIGVIAAIGGLVVGIVAVLQQPFPENLLILGVIAMLILPLSRRFWKRLFSRSTWKNPGPLRVWSCPGGLVYQQQGTMSATRWEDLRQVWRKLALVNGEQRIIGYYVQPVSTPALTLTLLSGPFDDLAEREPSGSVSVELGGYHLSNVGGFLQIAGPVDLSAYAGLGDLIEEELVRRQLPGLLTAYASGQPVAFGPFVVSRQELSDGVKTLAWSELDGVRVSEAGVQLTKKPASLVWFHLSAQAIPNIALLVALLTTLRSGQGR